MKFALRLSLFALVTLVGCSSLPTFTSQDLPPSVRVVDAGGWITLTPAEGAGEATGLIYYPGGLVRPDAYELALAPLAAAGYPVVIVKMPFDLAFFGADGGLAAQKALPSVNRWVIGGHSLGGVAAAMTVKAHPEAFAGVIFWASYPAGGTDLSTSDLPMLSISASLDGLSSPAEVEAARSLVPISTVRVVIEGGNHAQFGDYGFQKGDGTATLDRAEQQRQANEAVLAFLKSLP